MTKPTNSLLASMLAGIPSESEYYEHLGRLVTQYALVEQAIHIVARKISGLTDRDGRIVFSGMRISDIVQRIRALKSGDEKFLGEFNLCIAQFDLIGKQRDMFVHRAVHVIEGKLLVTNTLTAKSIDLITADDFGIEDIKAMVADCIAIYLRLTYLIKVTPKEKEETDDFVYAPWRYKPDAQSNRKSAK